MKKAILVASFFYFAIFILASNVEARLLPRFQSKGGSRGVVYSGLIVSPRLRSDRKALVVAFNNLQKVKNVTYTLIYQTNGKDEGVSGSVDSSSGNNLSRELLFGTCSSGVCRYHANIANMKLEILSELPSGKKSIKRFRIRRI
ncbi:hypothetical protein A3A46_01460 [Candidatus Roizmanbacteria bacterium RIFCSPLOWO2_01_FULL_37_13]|nr:MAG: hypothetical protein A3A46_01460 [Candidatus Roizmanbacteria bacterium RIFCSPLOWO2_01_FULL_37_13]